jgi:hypothetical protein
MTGRSFLFAIFEEDRMGTVRIFGKLVLATLGIMRQHLVLSGLLLYSATFTIQELD